MLVILRLVHMVLLLSKTEQFFLRIPEFDQWEKLVKYVSDSMLSKVAILDIQNCVMLSISHLILA